MKKAHNRYNLAVTNYTTHLWFKMEPPYLQRAKAFKSELFDSAGVEEKLLQKENEFIDLKKNMKLKV